MQAKYSIRTKLFAAASAAFLALICGLMAHSVLLFGQAAAKAAKPGGAASAQTGAKDQASLATPPGDEGAGDASDDDGPSPGNFLGSTYVPSNLSADGTGAPGAMAAVPPPPPPKPADAGGDATRQQINNETANLLAMAYALKAEVDKTNKDQLSINVVRKANQIELLARKVRDEMRPALSKN